MQEKLLSGKIIVKTGDITKENVDIVVNAANSTLGGGGGVDGAIHRAGGPLILMECKNIRETTYKEGLPAGKAIETTAGDMSAKWVVHTVGPVWKGGTKNEDVLLADCYRNSLNVAFRLKAGSIAFPAISTGIYGFPKDRAAGIAYRAVRGMVKDKEEITVSYVFFSEEDMKIFLNNKDRIWNAKEMRI